MCELYDIRFSSNKSEVVLTQEILLIKKTPLLHFKKLFKQPALKKYKKRKTRVYRDYRLLG